MSPRIKIFSKKVRPQVKVTVTLTPDGHITDVENPQGVRFPFVVGQLLQRNAETWACVNGYLIDGKDPCGEKKLFGVRVKDIPEGHVWRLLYPGRFMREGGITFKIPLVKRGWSQDKFNMDWDFRDKVYDWLYKAIKVNPNYMSKYAWRRFIKDDNGINSTLAWVFENRYNWSDIKQRELDQLIAAWKNAATEEETSKAVEAIMQYDPQLYLMLLADDRKLENYVYERYHSKYIEDKQKSKLLFLITKEQAESLKRHAAAAYENQVRYIQNQRGERRFDAGGELKAYRASGIATITRAMQETEFKPRAKWWGFVKDGKRFLMRYQHTMAVFDEAAKQILYVFPEAQQTVTDKRGIAAALEYFKQAAPQLKEGGVAGRQEWKQQGNRFGGKWFLFIDGKETGYRIEHCGHATANYCYTGFTPEGKAIFNGWNMHRFGNLKQAKVGVLAVLSGNFKFDEDGALLADIIPTKENKIGWMANSEKLKEGGNLSQLANTEEAYGILDASSGAGGTWLAGGCGLFAHALQLVVGGELYAVQNKATLNAEHIVLRIGEKFYDATGAHTKVWLETKYPRLEHITAPVQVVPLEQVPEQVRSTGCVYDMPAVKQLAEYFKKSNVQLKEGGALYVGPPHEHPSGGIPVTVVNRAQQPVKEVLVEGDEYKICEEAYHSPKVLVLEDATNKQALDYIHHEFSCTFDQHKAAAGDFIICKRVVLSSERKTRKGTVKEILNEMQAEGGCKVELPNYTQQDVPALRVRNALLKQEHDVLREGGSTFTVTDKNYAHQTLKDLISKVATRLMAQLKVNRYLISRDNFRMMLYDDKESFDALRRIYDRERNWREIEINRLRILRDKIRTAKENPLEEEKVIAEIMTHNPEDYLALVDEQTLLRYVDSKSPEHVNFHSNSSGKKVIPHFFIRFSKEEWQALKQRAGELYEQYKNERTNQMQRFDRELADRVRNIKLAEGGPVDEPWVMPENVTHDERQYEWELPYFSRKQHQRVLDTLKNVIAKQLREDLLLYEPKVSFKDILEQSTRIKGYLQQVVEREVDWLKREQHRLLQLQRQLGKNPERVVAEVMAHNPDEYLVLIGGKQAIKEYTLKEALKQNHLAIRVYNKASVNKVIRISVAEYERIKNEVLEILKQQLKGQPIVSGNPETLNKLT